MITKASWHKSESGLLSHLKYMIGQGRKKKCEGEKIYPPAHLSDLNKVKAYFAAHKHALEPKKKSQRKSKRTDLRLVVAFVGKTPKEGHKIAHRMLKEAFPDCLGTWSIHSKPVEQSGQKVAAWHIHFVISPRSKETGKILQLGKKELAGIKKSFAKVAHDFGIDTKQKEIEQSKNPALGVQGLIEQMILESEPDEVKV